MQKVLILLPSGTDRTKANKLDKGKYEVHLLYASDDAKDKQLPSYAYEPGFLASYVDRAVEYVNDNRITAIMFSHDLSSIVASVVCKRTGLPGPSLESTFRCLHKYYSRKTAEGKLWFDYIHLDNPVENWKDKVCYPCFLKPPYLAASKGCFCIRSEAELVTALDKIRPLATPLFKWYSEFFRKYLDLEKFPLAVENIVVLEELVESSKEYTCEGWMDGDDTFTMLCIWDTFASPKNRETIISFVLPQFSLDDTSVQKLTKFTEDMVRRFGLRNTFVDLEAWKDGDKFTLVEVNSRISATEQSDCFKEISGMSVYEAAVYLACGEIDTMKKKKTVLASKDGDLILGSFRIRTWGEGKAKDFIDFDYARTGSASDGVYNNGGLGALLFVSEDSQVKQTSSNGFPLGTFFINDDNANRMFERGKKIVDKILLRPEDRDVVEFPKVDNVYP